MIVNTKNFSKRILNNYFIQVVLSYILSKIISDWYLQSRLITESINYYEILWLNSGFIIAILFILWINNWQTSLNINFLKKQENSIKVISGSNYTLLIILNSSITILLVSLIFNFIFIYSENLSIYNLILLSIKYLGKLLYTKFYYFIILFVILLSKRISFAINSVVDMSFIYIIGRLWYDNNINNKLLNNDFIGSTSSKDLIGLLIILLAYILFKLSINIWRYLIDRNNLSDWQSYNIDRRKFKNLYKIFYIFPIILFFLIGLTY